MDLGNTAMHTKNPTAKVGSIPVQDMPGRTFPMPLEKDGSGYQAKIIKLVDDYRADAKTDPERIKFKCLVSDKYEEIVAYNQIVDCTKNNDSLTASGNSGRS